MILGLLLYKRMYINLTNDRDIYIYIYDDMIDRWSDKTRDDYLEGIIHVDE